MAQRCGAATQGRLLYGTDPVTPAPTTTGTLVASRRARLLLLGAVFAAAGGAYANSLANGFAMDDAYNVVANEQIRSLRGVPALFTRQWGADAPTRYHQRINRAYWRPLVAASFALDHSLWGLRPAGYHLTNVLLHAVVSLLVLVIVLRLTGSRWGAVAGALAFALHPVHTEVVNLISYRTELLAALFVTAAVALAGHGRAGPRRPWAPLALLLLYALGLASKETAVTLPGWLLLQELVLLREPGGDASRRPLNRAQLAWTYAPLVLCLAGYLALRAATLDRAGSDFFFGLEPGLRVLSVLKIYLHYVQLMLLPWPLLPFYDWTVLPPATSCGDATAYVGGAAVVLTAALAVALWRRGARAAGLGLLWWLLGLIPVLHIVALPVGAAERFLYLPSVGLCLALGAGAGALARRGGRAKTVALAVALPLLALMTLGTVVRNTHWRDDQTLLERAVLDFPESFNARHELGKRYVAQGRTKLALVELRAANELLPNIQPNVALLARALIKTGQGGEAAAVLRSAVKELGPQRELVELLRRARSE